MPCTWHIKLAIQMVPLGAFVFWSRLWPGGRLVLVDPACASLGHERHQRLVTTVLPNPQHHHRPPISSKIYIQGLIRKDNFGKQRPEPSELSATIAT